MFLKRAAILFLAPVFFACNSMAGQSLPETVRVIVDTHTVAATVDERYLSVAVDSSQVVGGHWWSESGEVEVGVGKELTDPYDFQRPRLRLLAAALAPAYLRIGGSEADVIYYDMSATPMADPPEPYEFVLDRYTWDGLCDFAIDLGLELMFTLNAGPGPRNAERLWTADNAETLIQYTLDRRCPVKVWELGNEINGFSVMHGADFRIRGDAYALDMAVAREMVDRIHPEGLLAGPSSAFWPVAGEVFPVLPEFMEHGGTLVDVVTWHYYPTQSQRCPVATREAEPFTLLEPENLDELNIWADEVEGLARQYAPDAKIWLGETGNAQCGGQPGVSDRFVAGFWWLDQLGQLARRGQQLVVRQTLSGSNYGLLYDPTLEPNPDYWASVLWKRLMGDRVLDTRAGADRDHVRAYAHCTPRWNTRYPAGSFTAVLLNLSREKPITVELEGVHGPYDLYIVDSPDLLGIEARLNGIPLALAPGGELPDMDAMTVSHGPVKAVLPAGAYAFVTVYASADACLGDQVLP